MDTSAEVPQKEVTSPKKGGRRSRIVLVYDEDTDSWSTDKGGLARDHTIYDGRSGSWLPFAGNEDIDDAATTRLTALLSPSVYVSPDGNWGDAAGLLLLTESEESRARDLTGLYDEYGDDLITAVRERLELGTGPGPELVLSYGSDEDVLTAIRNVEVAWNEFGELLVTPVLNGAINDLLEFVVSSVDDPQAAPLRTDNPGALVAAIVRILAVWGGIDHEEGADSGSPLDVAIDRLGDLLTSPEPSAPRESRWDFRPSTPGDSKNEDRGAAVEITNWIASIVYVYEIEANSEEEAEDQAREQFAEDFGGLSPRDFGCVTKPNEP
jgi:hypothetical protein